MISLKMQKLIVEATKGSGVPPYVLMAIAEKESNGVMFWSVPGETVPVPIFRPESHKFYKYLPNAKLRGEAINQRLASRKAGGVGVPAKSQARYIMLQRMRKIDDTAALMSISMGFGQVMGFHYKALGYSSVQKMWADAHTVEGQVHQVLQFFRMTPQLIIAAQKEDVKTIARLYNGAAYAKNNYDVDLQRYITRYKAASNGTVAIVENTNKAQEWNDRIKALGFDSVVVFQKQYNLNPDGIIGMLTKGAIKDAEAKASNEAKSPERTAANTGVAGAVIAGAGGIAANADLVGSTLRPILDVGTVLAGYSSTVLLGVGAAILCAAVVAFVYYRWQRKAS